MGNAEEILVIILASTLTIFLLVAILAIIKIIALLKHIQLLAEKAEKIADNASSVGEILKFTATPAVIVKTVANIVQTVLKQRNKGGKKW